MVKKIFYLVFLTTSFVYSQNINWVDITDHDLKFKIPEGYKYQEKPNSKSYLFEDSNKIITFIAFTNNTSEDISYDNQNRLKKYYRGIVDGFTQKEGFPIKSREYYKINEYFISKNIQEINFDDGSKNIKEIHVLSLNKTNYILTYQYAPNNSQEVLNDKKHFFDSLKINNSQEVLSKNTIDDSYQLGKLVGILIPFLVVIGLIIYFTFFRKKNR